MKNYLKYKFSLDKKFEYSCFEFYQFQWKYYQIEKKLNIY